MSTTTVASAAAIKLLTKQIMVVELGINGAMHEIAPVKNTFDNTYKNEILPLYTAATDLVVKTTNDIKKNKKLIQSLSADLQTKLDKFTVYFQTLDDLQYHRFNYGYRVWESDLLDSTIFGPLQGTAYRFQKMSRSANSLRVSLWNDTPKEPDFDNMLTVNGPSKFNFKFVLTLNYTTSTLKLNIIGATNVGMRVRYRSLVKGIVSYTPERRFAVDEYNPSYEIVETVNFNEEDSVLIRPEVCFYSSYSVPVAAFFFIEQN